MDALSSAVPSTKRRRFVRRHTLVIILAGALLLRLAVIPILGIHHLDELWQYLEPAHEIAFGRGVDAWEFRSGIRTWIMPAFLAPFMWLGDAIAPDGLLYIYLPKAVLALVSLVIVWSWWKLGLRVSRTHAIVAAFVGAIWVDLVHFGAKPLSEPISMVLFFPAAVILARHRLSRKELVIAGFLLGLAFSVRFQLAPALLCLVLWTEWRRLRQTMLWIIGGGLAALAMDGLIDLVAGELPFRWFIENFRINLIEGKSSEYGQSRAYDYFLMPLQRWVAVAGPILVLAGVGARRYPGLALVAFVHVAFHSLIPHKEFRFVLLAFEIIIFLAAIGTADAIRLAHSNRRWWMAMACSAWAAISLALAVTDPLRGEWVGSADLLKMLRIAGEAPRVCGLATYELDQPLSVAYTYYHSDTPMFGFKGDEAAFQANQDRFNVVVAHPKRPPGEPYSLARCTPPRRPYPPLFCVYQRPGKCSSRPAHQHEINRFLAEHEK